VNGPLGIRYTEEIETASSSQTGVTHLHYIRPLYIRRQPRLWRLAIVLLLASACGRVGYNALPTAGDGGSVIDASTSVDGNQADGGFPTATIVDTGGFPFAITSDATNVYWADFGDGSVHRLPIAGGASTELIPARTSAGVYGLTVGSGHVYVCDSSTGEIRRVPTIGGPVALLTTSPCYDLVVDDTHLYWSSTDVAQPTIRRLALPNGQPQNVGVNGTASNLRLVGSNLFWTSYSSGEIHRLPTSGGTSSLLATVATGGPWGLSVDNLYVYFAEHHPNNGEITRVPILGGAPDVLVTGMDGPHEIIADGPDLYWTNEFAGTISRLSTGAGPVAIASGQDQPLGIAVTTGAVFWTSRSGTVTRIDK
jgi:hypothetical protein